MIFIEMFLIVLIQIDVIKVFENNLFTAKLFYV